MFGISWLTPELFVQGLAIFIGIIIGTLLTFFLQIRQWAKEQAQKDMTEIYRPILTNMNELLKIEEILRKSPSSPYSTYTAIYKGLKNSGRVNLKIHDKLRRDMDDLIDRINNEDKAFNILLNKLESLCERIGKNIPVIMQDGKITSVYDWGYIRIEQFGIIYENREEWGTNFDNKIKRFEEGQDVDRVELKVTGKEIFDQLSSQIRNERENSFSKRHKIFAKAKEIKKKLDHKARYPMKKCGNQ